MAPVLAIGPCSCAGATLNLEIIRRERLIDGVREHERAFGDTLAQLLELPIVGAVRGAGSVWALELTKDKGTRESFNPADCEWLLRGFLSNRPFEAGLICRADDRGDPIIQISPPLIATQPECDRIAAILDDVLTEATAQVRSSLPARLAPCGHA
jgi:adenosylmethionine-8-amino-7-oxononanoate aminotransferase